MRCVKLVFLSDFFTQKTKKSQCKICDTSKFLKFYRKKCNLLTSSDVTNFYE